MNKSKSSKNKLNGFKDSSQGLNINELIQEGLSLHKNGDLKKAQAIYQLILKKEPGNSDALHYLGIIAAQSNNLTLAEELIKKSIEIYPHNPAAHFNLGNTYQDRGDHEKALESFEIALKINPNDFQVHFARGNSLTSLHAYGDALICYELTIKINSKFAKAYFMRGVVLEKLNRLQESLNSYELSILINPRVAITHFNKGLIHQKLNQHELAISSYDSAIELQPRYAEAYSNRGIALREVNKNKIALESFDQAIKINPHFSDAFYNRAESLILEDRILEAITDYNSAIKFQPNFPEALYNKGIALHRIQKVDEAINCYDAAIDLDGENKDAYWNKSLALLLKGDYKNGWALYESRWNINSFSASFSQYTKPIWTGNEDIKNKRVLLVGEQGLGDMIQFCRYASIIKSMNAEVILETPKELNELLKNFNGISQILERGSAIPDYDYYCPLMSLPYLLGTSLENIPSAEKYIYCPDYKNQEWSKRLGERNKYRVGIVWSGGFRKDRPDLWAVNKRRNIGIELISEFLSEVDVEYHSLQKGEPAESEIMGNELLYFPNGNLINHADNIKSFSDTAGLIENIDLVISVDTSTAHLSAAMGKPTWILNRHDNCWRWLTDIDYSPWYKAVKIYRQPEIGDWRSLLKNVRQDLLKIIN